MQPSDLPSPSCPYMSALIEMLSEFPTDRSRSGLKIVADRLEGLEREARTHAAPVATLTAIQSARVLLGMAEMPPEAQADL